MHRARTRVLVAPEWSSNSSANVTYGSSAEPSLRERLSQLVSDGAVSLDGDRTASAAEPVKPTDSDHVEELQNGGNAVAPSPGPEPAAAASVIHKVLYPPPVPPYAAVRSAWPEVALLDLIKQQALYPTDVNVRVGCSALGVAAGAPRSGLLRAISEEAQTNITAAPASASFQFVQLLADLCGRAGAAAGGGQLGECMGSVGPGQGNLWRRPQPLASAPARPAPALAMAAAATGCAAVPQLEATPLGVPAALVGFEGDWLAVQPAILPCWDKVSLEPCGPPKAAQYYMVCGEQHASAARMFVRDVSATFLAMRLGTHTVGRTPAHLHSIEGVIPVPLDLGPGPPHLGSAAADGGGDAAGAAAALGWSSLPRRLDPSVIRSAVLGFRSNHANASVAGEPDWTPDEPCYRPRRAVGPVPAGVAPAAGSEGAGGAGSSGSTQQQQQQAAGPLCSYWRNLRHVGRQLQRHLLLQPPSGNQQQEQGVLAAAATASSSSGMGGPSGRGGAGNGSGCGDARAGEEAPDAAPPAFVVYVVPPSDRDEDVVRALLELCACLAPATPAARAPPAPVPLAAPPPPPPCRRHGDAAGTTTGGEPQSHQQQQQRRFSLAQQQQQYPHIGHGDVVLAGLASNCRWPGGEGFRGGAAPSASGPDAAAMIAAGLTAASGGGSAASTPPEPPACSSTTNTNGPPCSSSGAPTCGGGGGATANGGTTDPALLARLGGAALHLYRTASCPPAGGAVPGSGSSPQSQWSLSPQLDLSQLAATDVTVQVVLPSSLHDITGASVRATACSVYSKLCRRRAVYGASAAGGALAASLSQQTAASATAAAVAAPAPALTLGPRSDGASTTTRSGGGGGAADARCVVSSCSGRTTLYEPLVALAPLSLPTVAEEDPAALPLPPPPPPHLAQQRGLSPGTLREGGGVSSPLRTAEAGAAAYAQQRQQEAVGTPTAATAPAPPAPPPRPTLHGCYAWWRCPETGGRQSAEGRAGPGSTHWASSSRPTQPQRCWLAMAFCDGDGKLLDTRALTLHLDHLDKAVETSATTTTTAAAAASGRGGVSGLAAPVPACLNSIGEHAVHASPPCSCRPDGAVSSAADASVDGSVARHGLGGLGGRCRSGAGSGGIGEGDVGDGDGFAEDGPHGWSLQNQGSTLSLPVGPSRTTSTPIPAVAVATGGAAVAAAAPPPPPPLSTAATSLDGLVCRAVLGHARLLSRQLAEAHQNETGASTDGAFSPGGGGGGAAAVPSGGARRRGAKAAAVTLAMTKLGPPTAAEAAEWRKLVQAGAGAGERRSGSTSLRRRWDQAAPPPPSPAAAAAASTAGGAAAGESAVTLAWLDPHPSVAVHPGCRLPQGGFAVSGPAAAPPLQPNPTVAPGNPYTQNATGGGSAAGGGGTRTPVTLVAFPAQRPPSASCAAAEVLNRHLRLLSVHPWPSCAPPPAPQPLQTQQQLQVQSLAPQTSGSISAGADRSQAVPLQANGSMSTAAAAANQKRTVPGNSPNSSSPGVDAAAGMEQQPGKRRRWGDRLDGGSGATSAGLGTVPYSPGAACTAGGAAAPGLQDPWWSTLRDLYGLCVLRDWLLAAQSGARGGPATGGRLAGGVGSSSAASAAGDWAAAFAGNSGEWDAEVGSDAGSDAPLLLPLHAAVCRQLLRILAACEQLAAGS